MLAEHHGTGAAAGDDPTAVWIDHIPKGIDRNERSHDDAFANLDARGTQAALGGKGRSKQFSNGGTRAGAGTNMVFTGDVFQIDHPYLDKHSNGLSYLIAKMAGQPLYAHVNLVKGERSRLAELASDLL